MDLVNSSKYHPSPRIQLTSTFSACAGKCLTGGGAAYAGWTIATQSHVTNSSVLLIVLSVVIFLVGLVSEQISSLRFEGRR